MCSLAPIRRCLICSAPMAEEPRDVHAHCGPPHQSDHPHRRTVPECRGGGGYGDSVPPSLKPLVCLHLPEPHAEIPHPLDAATNAVTAFRTWADFVAALAGGYYPTLHGRTRRERLLIRAVRAAGYRSYPADARVALHRDGRLAIV